MTSSLFQQHFLFHYQGIRWYDKNSIPYRNQREKYFKFAGLVLWDCRIQRICLNIRNFSPLKQAASEFISTFPSPEASYFSFFTVWFSHYFSKEIVRKNNLHVQSRETKNRNYYFVWSFNGFGIESLESMRIM